MKGKDILKHILEHCDVSHVKLLAKAALTLPVIKDIIKEPIEDLIIKKLKKYGADVTIKKLKLKPASTTLCVHLEADGELDREGMTKVLTKIGL